MHYYAKIQTDEMDVALQLNLNLEPTLTSPENHSTEETNLIENESQAGWENANIFQNQ